MFPPARLLSRAGRHGASLAQPRTASPGSARSCARTRPASSASSKEDIMFRFRKPALTADAATHGLASNHANQLGYSHLVDPTRSPRGRKLMNVKILPVAMLLLPMASRGDSLSA